MKATTAQWSWMVPWNRVLSYPRIWISKGAQHWDIRCTRSRTRTRPLAKQRVRRCCLTCKLNLSRSSRVQPRTHVASAPQKLSCKKQIKPSKDCGPSATCIITPATRISPGAPQLTTFRRSSWFQEKRKLTGSKSSSLTMTIRWLPKYWTRSMSRRIVPYPGWQRTRTPTAS